MNKVNSSKIKVFTLVGGAKYCSFKEVTIRVRAMCIINNYFQKQSQLWYIVYLLPTFPVFPIFDTTGQP